MKLATMTVANREELETGKHGRRQNYPSNESEQLVFRAYHFSQAGKRARVTANQFSVWEFF